MFSSRRQFLRVALTGAATLPFAGKIVASYLLNAPTDLLASDAALLNEIESGAFEFFWNEVNPDTGLVLDRANASGGSTCSFSSIAASGFGLTALCIGHEREYRSRSQIEQRVAQTLDFISRHVPTEHGFLYHFLDPTTGKRALHSEVSPIDTAILLCGVLTCREHFRDAPIKRDAPTIYNRVACP